MSRPSCVIVMRGRRVRVRQSAQVEVGVRAEAWKGNHYFSMPPEATLFLSAAACPSPLRIIVILACGSSASDNSCPDHSKSIETSPDQSRPVQTSPDQSRSVQFYPDLSRSIQFIQIRPDQSRSIQKRLLQSTEGPISPGPPDLNSEDLPDNILRVGRRWRRSPDNISENGSSQRGLHDNIFSVFTLYIGVNNVIRKYSDKYSDIDFQSHVFRILFSVADNRAEYLQSTF